MTRGVSLFVVGSCVLVALAGCGRGFMTAEREPWRAEAEKADLKSGAVRESADLVRIDPISGPGACGAEFPLKVAALGESNSSLGYADDRQSAALAGVATAVLSLAATLHADGRTVLSAAAALSGIARRAVFCIRQRTDAVECARCCAA